LPGSQTGDLIDQLLTSQVKLHKTPSVEYLFFDDSTIIHRFQNGWADIANEIEADEKTTYHGFSVTKTFTALSIMRLVESKTIDIDDPVKKYLPDFPYSAGITTRQVLTHSSGIPNPIPLKWIHRVREPSTFNCNDFFNPIFIKNKTKTAPNEKYVYSNLAYVLLGQLIEAVSGLKYETYVIENILRPLNIRTEELGFTISNFDRHAKGYIKTYSFTNAILGFMLDKGKYLDSNEKGWTSFHYNYVNGPSYGGLIGTANAFARYLQELLKPYPVIFTAESKKNLFTENHTNDGKATGVGLSWFKGALNGNPFYTHAGGGGGYYCELRIYPEASKGSVIMFNRTGFKDERFLDQVDRYFFM
jgi:CubicO group peptidase (beta-lactamase class C family)